MIELDLDYTIMPRKHLRVRAWHILIIYECGKVVAELVDARIRMKYSAGIIGIR